MAVVHGVEARAAGHALDLRAVVLELAQRHRRDHRAPVAREDPRVQHAPALRGDIPGEIAHVLRGGGDLDLDERLGAAAGVAFFTASMNALRPAVMKAISFESTAWYLPSYTSTFSPVMG